MYRYTILLLIILSACQPKGNSTTSSTENEKKSSGRLFEAPQIPSILVAEEEKRIYAGSHYWEHFPFADTTMIGKREQIDPYFTEFILLLAECPPETIEQTVGETLDRAFRADSALFSLFVELYEHNAADPNSPVRNEEIYIRVLEYIVQSNRIDEIYKLRHRKLLELVRKNRVGQEANDFGFITDQGMKGSLKGIRTAYTVVFFNNPDCEDCKRVKAILSNNDEVNRRIGTGQLTLLALYPDDDLQAWKKTEYPSTWINSYNPNGIIHQQQLYDLKAIPCLYLLDQKKRVVLKDAPVEMIVDYLYRMQ